MQKKIIKKYDDITGGGDGKVTDNNISKITTDTIINTQYWNNKKDEETTRSVAKVFKTNKTVITSYLKEGSKLGWCVYNPEEEKSKSDNKFGKNGKKVRVFKDGKELGIFESTNEVERISKNMFGVEMRSRSIARVCRGERNHHKGYIFKYVEE